MSKTRHLTRPNNPQFLNLPGTHAAFVEVAGKTDGIGSNTCTALRIREGGVHLQRRFSNGASPDDTCGYSGNCGVRRNVFQNNATGGDFCSDPNLDISQNLGARADEHSAPYLRVSIARLFARSAQGDFVQQRYVVFDDRGLADDDTRAVVD